MSSTANHKKAADITAACVSDKKLLLKIYFKIMRDCPSAIVNGYREVMEEAPRTTSPEEIREAIHEAGKKMWPEYKCPECKKTVSALGIAGACIKCDPRGFDHTSL
jgi:hypothetical protein